jgi:mono/diheme cytochrome c family protein
MNRWIAVGLMLLAATGCKHEIEPPDREARVRDAEARFESERFDTLNWESDDARALAGNEVFAAKCRTCHGTLGAGGTEYATGRGLEVPSLIEPGWVLSDSLDAVRRRVFVGHASGMPTWGVAGISARDIDAVAFYLLESLRPEVVNEGDR